MQIIYRLRYRPLFSFLDLFLFPQGTNSSPELSRSSTGYLSRNVACFRLFPLCRRLCLDRPGTVSATELLGNELTCGTAPSFFFLLSRPLAGFSSQSWRLTGFLNLCFRQVFLFLLHFPFLPANSVFAPGRPGSSESLSEKPFVSAGLFCRRLLLKGRGCSFSELESFCWTVYLRILFFIFLRCVLGTFTSESSPLMPTFWTGLLASSLSDMGMSEVSLHSEPEWLETLGEGSTPGLTGSLSSFILLSI